MARPNDRVLPVDFITADASFSRSVWHFQIPRKFTFADCLDPELWRHNAKLKENDLVDVIGEAGDFDCSLRVLAAERGMVIFRILREWHAAKEPVYGEVGEAHVALVIGAGWTLFNSLGHPVARYGDEDSARKALAELPAAPASEPGVTE